MTHSGDIDEEELRELATGLMDENILAVEDFDDLLLEVERLANETCNGKYIYCNITTPMELAFDVQCEHVVIVSAKSTFPIVILTQNGKTNNAQRAMLSQS